MGIFETAAYPVFPYVTGLKISWASNTTLTVTSGQTLASNGIVPLVTTSTITINAAVNGVNGLDTGTFAASTRYYVYMIGDSSGQQSTGFILSTSSTTPTLPGIANSSSLTGAYDSYRRIGVWSTDGSTHFNVMYQLGSGSIRTYYWDTLQIVLTSGTAASFTAIDLSSAVLSTVATRAVFNFIFTPNVAADGASFRPTGSSATSTTTMSGVVAAKNQVGQFVLNTGNVAGVQKIDYQLSSASDSLSLYVFAFDDAL